MPAGSEQLDELFATYLDAYTPVEHPLPIKLQPFVPDYLPAFGGPNTFTAPPRPDGAPDFLGLTVLDEPALQQSNPASVALQLREQLKQRAGGYALASEQPSLGWLADPAHQPHLLDNWIQQVEAFHQDESQAVALAPPLPDLEALMQAWPPELQAQVRSKRLPDPQQEVDLATFARMACSVLELPVGGGMHGLVGSLHTLFALYLEFKHNPAFQHKSMFLGQCSDT